MEENKISAFFEEIGREMAAGKTLQGLYEGCVTGIQKWQKSLVLCVVSKDEI